jgi:outer membrane protein
MPEKLLKLPSIPMLRPLAVEMNPKRQPLYAIESRLDQIKADSIEAEAKVVTAKQGLIELTNNTPVNLAKLRDEIDYKELEGKLDEWLDVAKSENPTLVAQQYAIAAADLDVATQKARHLPVVELQLNYFNTNTGFQSVSTNQVETEVAAINVNVPIFSGGVTTKRTQEAQHKLTLNKYDNESKLRALVKETSDAFLTSNANVRGASRPPAKPWNPPARPGRPWKRASAMALKP